MCRDCNQPCERRRAGLLTPPYGAYYITQDYDGSWTLVRRDKYHPSMSEYVEHGLSREAAAWAAWRGNMLRWLPHAILVLAAFLVVASHA